MDGKETLFRVCLSDKNINIIINAIKNKIKLSDRSIPRCTKMIEEIMRNNIKRLNGLPSNKEEMTQVIKYFNQKCIDEIISIIVKKYPDALINGKKQASRVQMDRELDTFGDRENSFMDRPHTRSKKEHAEMDDDEFMNMKSNDVGYGAYDNSSMGSYASAFGNHSITGMSPGQQQEHDSQKKPRSESGSFFT